LRALIVFHDAGHAADNYFRTALAAAFLAGAFKDKNRYLASEVVSSSS
jgi:hypothetical protein